MTNRQYRIIPTFFASGAPGWTFEWSWGGWPWEKHKKVRASKESVKEEINKFEALQIVKDQHLKHTPEIYIPKVPSGG